MSDVVSIEDEKITGGSMFEFISPPDAGVII
jgi:hypothetical protein